MNRFRDGQCVTWTHYGWNELRSCNEGQPREGYVIAHDKSKVVLLTLQRRKLGASKTCFYAHEWHKLYPGSKPDATLLRAWRGDFLHFAIIVGRKMVIRAGCNVFATFAAAKKHWTTRRRVKKAYSKSERVWGGRHGLRDLGRYYDTRPAVRQRALDKRYNKFSLAFARKAERIRAKA